MKQTASYGLGLKLSNSQPKNYCSGAGYYYYGVPSFSFSAKYYQTTSSRGRSFLLSSNKNFKFSTSQTKFQKRFDDNNNNNNNNAFIFRFSQYSYCTDKGTKDLVEEIEINKIKEELEIVKMQISKVENEIVQVNKDLTIVSEQLQQIQKLLEAGTENPEQKERLLKKEEHLLKKEEQLRKEKEQLLKKEEQLRELLLVKEKRALKLEVNNQDKKLPYCFTQSDLFIKNVDYLHNLIEEDEDYSNLLKSLKRAQTIKLPGDSGVSIIQLDSEIPEIQGKPNAQIFIRSFYPELFGYIRKNNVNAIVIGNPGIGKSCFQWYLLHLCLTSESLSPTSDGYTTPPRVILRQLGTISQVWFLKEEIVFEVDKEMVSLMKYFNPTFTYLFFDPFNEKNVTVPYNGMVKVIATVSPNIDRYKEFLKNGAQKYYVPCWTLNELLAVGSYLRETQSTSFSCITDAMIKERFLQYGGIIRYVFRSEKLLPIIDFDTFLKDNQCYVVNRTDIIETNPEHKGHVTHLIYQYDVPLPPDEMAFRWVCYQWSSERVRKQALSKYVRNHFSQLFRDLNDMLNGQQQFSPILFEDVICTGIMNQFLEWTVNIDSSSTRVGSSDNDSQKNNNISWQPFFSFHKISTTTLFEKRMEMLPGVLYRPVAKNFPGVDFLFLDDSQGVGESTIVSALQLTTSPTHPKDASVYMKLFDSVSLSTEEKIQIFIVCPEKYAEGYVNGIPGKMIAKFRPSSPLSLLSSSPSSSSSSPSLKLGVSVDEVTNNHHHDLNLASLIDSYRNLDSKINRILKNNTRQTPNTPSLKSDSTESSEYEDTTKLLEKKNEIASTILMHKIKFKVLKFRLRGSNSNEERTSPPSS